MRRAAQRTDRPDGDDIPTLSRESFAAEARGMDCPPFVWLRDMEGKELLYDLRNWSAQRRWKRGKPPHWTSVVLEDEGDRGGEWHRNRAVRFAAMASMMGHRHR